MTVRQGGLVAVVLGVVLLPVGVGAAISDHTSAKAALERALDNLAQTQAQLLSDHFARARSVNLLMSNNPSLSDIFELPGDRKARITGGSRTVDRANEALAYLETLFPRSIGEVCLIDRSGAEEARVVRGERAQFDELSLAENEAPFFSPTFALDQGSVYQAAPYGSPDTDEWVVSNSTKLPAAGDTTKAIVHFEITVESLREAAATGSDVPVLVVDATTGAVIIDRRHAQAAGNLRTGDTVTPGAPLGRPDDERFRTLTREARTTAGCGWRTGRRRSAGSTGPLPTPSTGSSSR